MATPKKQNYQTKISLSDKYTADQREAIAAEVISHIRRRSLRGIGADGSKFPSYSKEYIKSVDFKAAGKSKGSINLTLSGDMLASMDLVKSQKGEIVIGYSEDDPQIGKVEGNQIGSYGKPRGDSSKARRFLGIDKDSLQKILSKYPVSDREEANARAEAVLEAQRRVDRFVSQIEQEGADEIDPTELAKRFRLRVGG